MTLKPFTDADLPSFADRLIVLPDFLPRADFAALKAEIESLQSAQRGYVPTHKKGGTIGYDALREQAPLAVALYQNPEFQALVSRLVGATVVPTPLTHPTSLSVLRYDRPGDHIGWHYDHNFYKGRFFTVLLAIENTDHKDGLSSARLLARKPSGEISIPTPANMLVVFEGPRILHRVTQVQAGELRIMLSMTYCTDPRYSFFKNAVRKVKDTAFFGLKALWS